MEIRDLMKRKNNNIDTIGLRRLGPGELLVGFTLSKLGYEVEFGCDPSSVNVFYGSKELLEARAKGLSFVIKNVKYKKVVMLGYDQYIFKELLKKDATVTVINEHTRNKSELLRQADLIITLPNSWLLNCYPIHVPVIDFGNVCFNKKGKKIITNKSNRFELVGILRDLVDLW